MLRPPRGPLGRLVIGCLGGAVGWLAGTLLRIRRAEVEARLAHAGIGHPRRFAAQMYHRLGLGLVELLLVSPAIQLTPAAARFMAKHRGRGVVLAATHTGNWDGAALAVAKEHPISIVTKRLSVRWLDGFWQWLRGRKGIELIEPKGAATRVARSLNQGRWVACMIDQRPSEASRQMSHPFLGQPCNHDLAPALLAARAGVPFAVCVARRLGPGLLELDVPLVLSPASRGKRAWAESATKQAADGLGEFVMGNPADWLWLHRRWLGAQRLPVSR